MFPQTKIFLFLRRNLSQHLVSKIPRRGCRSEIRCSSCFHTSTQNLEERDAPVKYSTSQAKNWKAFETFANKPHQAPIIILSSVVFLTYFCLLREENDLDEEIGRSLFDKIPGLEEQQLMVRIDHDKLHGANTAFLERRLEELRASKAQNS